MAKFETNASGAIWWPNFQLMQVALYLAGEITQVKEPIPWVRCASGNVLGLKTQLLHKRHIRSILFLMKQHEIESLKVTISA